ncbi:MAG: hypothetical protein HWE16_09375 [Gammaproteobacteria bacterium]|nr:hypothetical protein [Gammaproteobacteria bacterium]
MRLLIVLLLFSVASAQAEDYSQQLDYLESIRLKEIQTTKQKLAKLEPSFEQFSDFEKARFLNLKAHSLFVGGEINQGIAVAEQVAKFTTDFDQLARARSLLTSAYAMSGNYKEFFIGVYELLDDLHKVQSNELRQAILSNALTRHTSARVFDKARELANKALSYGFRSNEKMFVCNAYIELARIEILSENSNAARVTLDKAEPTCTKQAIPMIDSLIVFLGAQIDQMQGKPQQALKKLEQLKPSLEDNGWKAIIVLADVLSAELHLAIGDAKTAEQLALAAYHYTKAQNDLEILKDACELLSKYYAKIGDDEKSKQFYQEFLEVSVEFYSQVESKRMAYYQAMNYRAKQSLAE